MLHNLWFKTVIGLSSLTKLSNLMQQFLDYLLSKVSEHNAIVSNDHMYYFGLINLRWFYLIGWSLRLFSRLGIDPFK